MPRSASKSEKPQAAFFAASDHEPLIIRLQITRVRDQQAIRPTQFRKARRDILIAIVLQAPPLKAEKLNVGFGDWLTARGIGDEIERFIVERLLNNRRISDPQDCLTDVAIDHARG